ncbi:hypothetical protein D9757_003224 [Collybiopsis confluens]|uniref:Protein kinase domain-containing protein n=1 Tax=Collybiopsis confluens TaxID=2823264 RepID=A0A8H5HZC9_9AGAR|nr:hypothetical protein D9757_003224 [Collybiopsis confluens]
MFSLALCASYPSELLPTRIDLAQESPLPLLEQYSKQLSEHSPALEFLGSHKSDEVKAHWEKLLQSIQFIPVTGETGVVDAEKKLAQVVFDLVSLARFDLDEKQVENIGRWTMLGAGASTETDTRTDILVVLHSLEQLQHIHRLNKFCFDSPSAVLEALRIPYLDPSWPWNEIQRIIGALPYECSPTRNAAKNTSSFYKDVQPGVKKLLKDLLGDKATTTKDRVEDAENGHEENIDAAHVDEEADEKDAENGHEENIDTEHVDEEADDADGEEEGDTEANEALLLNVMKWVVPMRDIWVQIWSQMLRDNLTFGAVSTYNDSFLIKRYREDQNAVISYLLEPDEEDSEASDELPGFILQRVMWLLDALNDAIARYKEQPRDWPWKDPYKSQKSSFSDSFQSSTHESDEDGDSPNDPDYIPESDQDESDDGDNIDMDDGDDKDSNRGKGKRKARKRSSPDPASDNSPGGKGPGPGGAGGAGALVQAGLGLAMVDGALHILRGRDRTILRLGIMKTLNAGRSMTSFPTECLQSAGCSSYVREYSGPADIGGATVTSAPQGYTTHAAGDQVRRLASRPSYDSLKSDGSTSTTGSDAVPALVMGPGGDTPPSSPIRTPSPDLDTNPPIDAGEKTPVVNQPGQVPSTSATIVTHIGAILDCKLSESCSGQIITWGGKMILEGKFNAYGRAAQLRTVVKLSDWETDPDLEEAVTAGGRKLQKEARIYEHLARIAPGLPITPKYFGVFEYKGSIALVLEDGGDPLSKRSLQMVEKNRKCELFEMAKRLHQCGVIHNQLYYWNILKDDMDNLSIIDFSKAELGHVCRGPDACPELEKFAQLLKLNL